MGGLLELAIFLGLLATGYVVGRVIEQRHYASIRLRERSKCRASTRAVTESR